MSDMLLILLPGSMYFWILFIGQAPLQEILQEQESRVLPRILACPVTPGQYLLSKLLRSFVLCSLAIMLLLGSSALLFGMHWGSPVNLVPVIAVWSWSMTGLLGLIYSSVRTREQANVLSPLVLMLFAMLGGSMFPFENLPSFMQAIGQFTPNRWAFLVLKAAVQSKPLTEIARPLAGLIALGAIGSLGALFLFSRRITTGGQK
jgi:linearmycin/streptolysin S transport system permease protein